MENVMKKVGRASSFLTKYIGIIIICFSVIAFFWRDGFAWTTNYTSIFLGVAMFGMGLTIKMDDLRSFFKTERDHDRICGTIHDHACCGMGIMSADASSDRPCTRRYSSRMLSRGNSK